MPATETQAKLAWALASHRADILAIEQASYLDPLEEAEYVKLAKERSNIVLVALVDERVAGYCIYELQRGRIAVLRMAVHPRARRRGVGRALIDKLAGKLTPHRRRYLQVAVRESNLDGQLFLRACGFKASRGSIQHKHFSDGETAYLMRLYCEGEA